MKANIELGYNGVPVVVLISESSIENVALEFVFRNHDESSEPSFLIKRELYGKDDVIYCEG